ncbi:MAG: PAS domain-containing protein [Sulfuricella sp.]|nr:PAS domain-containing protein [Sulfuricella sp.]
MADQSMAINLLIDPETGSILSASSDMGDFYGYSAERLVAMNISDIALISAAEIGERIGQSTHLQTIPLSIRRASGEIRPARAYASRILVDGANQLFLCVFEHGPADAQPHPASDAGYFLDLGFLRDPQS